ncbi:hypothetical protein V8D89_007039 [Ganoderma adspersum]
MPEAATELRPVNINDLALNTTLYYAADLSYIALDIGLSSGLFGVLTFLVVIALVFLIRKGFGHTPVRILLPSTLLLYGSTVLFMASLVGHVTSINRLLAQAQAGLFSESDSDSDGAYTNAALDAFQDDVLRHSWMMTAALATNLLIGDSIVWWRVCAVWPRNRAVCCLGPLLIVLVFAFGVKTLCGEQRCLDPPQVPQALFGDNAFADACAVLSLAVNVLATALIGYKAWVHRRLLRGQFGHGPGQQSRVVKALALLVESGTIYCLLLIMVVVYQATPSLFATPDVHENALLRAVAEYTLACFVPVIGCARGQAIYPVLIIVIVALNWSPIEHGLSGCDGSGMRGVPRELASPHPPTMMVSTVVLTDTMRMGYGIQIQNNLNDGRPADTETKQGIAVTVVV